MFDKAIINPEDNTELAIAINDIIEVYRETHDIDLTRGQCYNEVNNFLAWAKEQLEDLGEEFKKVNGYFYVDNPEGLPLDLMDLDDDERERFFDYYDEDEIPPTDYYDEYNARTLSSLIWDFAQVELAFEDDWNIYDHSWIEFENLLIDLTKEQFSNATIGEIKKDRYMKEAYEEKER